MPDLVATPNTAPVIAEWDHPLADPNLEDAAIAHLLSPLAKVPLANHLEPALRRRLRHKCWQYMTASNPDAFVAFVVGTAGFAGNGFVYVVEPRTAAVHSKFAITPLSRGVALAPSSTAGTHRFAGKDLEITIDNRDGGRAFVARIRAPGIAAELAFHSAPTDEHHAVCVPLADRRGTRWNYTHKYGAFTVDGTLTLGDRTLVLTGDRTFGTMDFSKMYAKRHAVWRWNAIAGRTRAGKIVGINLVDPTPEAAFSENNAWIDGRRFPLGHVHLDAARPDDPRSPWRLEADGLALEMRAITHVEQRLNAPLLRHRLLHVVGAFSGTLTAGGETHELVDVVGIAEDNDTWW